MWNVGWTEMGTFIKAVYEEEGGEEPRGVQFTLPDGIHDFEVFLNGTLLLKDCDYEVRNGVLYVNEEIRLLDVLMLLPFDNFNHITKPIILYGMPK